MTASSNAPAAARLTAAARRAQLAELAARRFQELGYHHVSLADVAADAGVTAPAVYRHFRNKQDLLAAAIASGLDAAEVTLAHNKDSSLEQVVLAIAELVQNRRYIWPLLQREARFLGPTLRAAMQRQFDRVINEFSLHLVRHRPELGSDDVRLLITAATSVLASPSLPRSAPRTLVTQELADAAIAVLQARLPRETTDGSPHPATTPPHEATDRRTQLLDTAIELFFHQGYDGVSLDDIGAALGIAGPSIYHHFPTKVDILVAAFARATDRLAEQDTQQEVGSSRRTLSELVGAYTDFCLSNWTLVGIYVWETMNLPPGTRRQIQAALRARVSEWTTAVRAETDIVDQRAARVRAHAALTLIDDLVRLGHFHQRPRIAAEVRSLALTVLTHPGGPW